MRIGTIGAGAVALAVAREALARNCTDVCPKDLNPARAIAEIKKMLVERHS